ncbi:hypothetical protein B0H13DRAFT_283491 [Mycena leptocephala]|nr:hypothetical protein B0H13DRAFT_283491 [Mycena leptocephala]
MAFGQGLSDFPPELLAKIFLHLSYKSLLCVLAVSVQWNAIVSKDPALSVQMFKRLSTVYVETGCNEPSFRVSPECYAAASESVRIHPALNEASYVMGERVESVYFFKMSSQPQLVALAIANDFISIPVVTMAKLVIPNRIVYPNGFKIKVTNSKGVRVSDVFAAMNKESNTKVDHPHYGIMTKWELLGDHRHYEGFSEVARTGLGLSASLYLGS